MRPWVRANENAIVSAVAGIVASLAVAVAVASIYGPAGAFAVSVLAGGLGGIAAGVTGTTVRAVLERSRELA